MAILFIIKYAWILNCCILVRFILMLLESSIDHDSTCVQWFRCCKLECVVCVLPMRYISVLIFKPLNFHYSIVISMVSLMIALSTMRCCLDDVRLTTSISVWNRCLTLWHVLTHIGMLRIAEGLVPNIQWFRHKLISLPPVTTVLLRILLLIILDSSIWSRAPLRHWEIYRRRLNSSEILRLRLNYIHRSSWLWMNFHNVCVESLRVYNHIFLTVTTSFKSILVSLYALTVMNLRCVSLIWWLDSILIICRW